MARRAKPTALKDLSGVKPSRINREEPKPKKGIGAPREFLDDLGKVAWQRMAKILDDMGVMTVADEEVLSLYCSSFSRWIRAEQKLSEQGEVINTRTTIKPNPWIQVSNESHRQMMKILIEFGLTPSSRAGIKVIEDLAEDPLLSYLKRTE